MHVLQGLSPQEESNELVSYPLHTFTHPHEAITNTRTSL